MKKVITKDEYWPFYYLNDPSEYKEFDFYKPKTFEVPPALVEEYERLLEHLGEVMSEISQIWREE